MAEPRYLQGRQLAIVIASLWLGTMLVAIDNTIIGTAVPEISAQFNALEDVAWYGSGYLLTVTAFGPTFGRLFKFFDPKYTYLVAIAVFEVGSVLCAAAPNSYSFIIGRAVAGAGAAGLFQGALTIIGLTTPMEERPMYNSIVASVFGLAMGFGPPLGGVLTDSIGWRWCFWINLPIGGVVMALLFFFLHLKETHNADRKLRLLLKIKKLDFGGGFLVFAAVCSLLLALQWGGSRYKWSSPTIVGLFVTLSVVLVAFVVLQLRLGENGTIPPRIISQRSVLMGSLLICFSQSASMVLAYYLPFYFQAVQGTSAVVSGVRYLPLVLPQVVALVVSGGIATKTGHYVSLMVGGQSVAAIGLGLLTKIDIHTKTVEWATYLVVSGLGIGAAATLPFAALQAVLEDEDMPVGNAIVTFFSQVGGSISVGIAQNLFYNTVSREVRRTVDGISPELITHVGATQLRSLNLPLETLFKVRVAFSRGVSSTLFLALALAAVGIFFAAGMEWKNLKVAAAERRHKEALARNATDDTELGGLRV
ncbi:permease of the major facilitator superfamily [Amniculicola lignicola CBS 123094]|uniref:Permease of the major facilitator superfamily n=1 Tax=Amniculicola lignicola CBS 123094 TaxID=1392246 RepID=A0A6A5WAV9_9PLEO|nr:permease of the major facilitator superfamily [Amniculicola lignicola CBS 123094]